MNCLTNACIKKFLPLPTSFLRRSFLLGGNQCYSTAELKGEQQSDVSISKEVLIKMRKETGYSYVKCRKALVKFGEQNYSEAKRWIKEIAAKEGWEKAAKLSNRVSTQGLCAFISEGNIAVMVELNCETDFVAQTAEFKQLVQQLTSSLLEHAKQNIVISGSETIEEGKLNFIEISPKEFNLPDGRSAEEAIVSYIGKLGENIILRSSKIILVDPLSEVIGHTHPNEQEENVQMGRFLSFIALKRNQENSGFPTQKLGRQICHHIIGMLPEKLGEPPVLEQQPTSRSENNAKASQAAGDDEEEDEEDMQVTNINENETQLLRQPFMFSPQQSIFEYLNYHGASVSDFMRLELGQENEEN